MGPAANDETSPAFGKNLYSPVNGTIVEVRHGLEDFKNTDGFNDANNYGWGNTIVILDESGEFYVRLAHLRQGSTDHLYEGMPVDQYEIIGQVGQTGYSSGPHLHIQVMEKTHEPTSDIINEVSSPFTFVEADFGYDEWAKSGLIRKIGIIDNNDEQSLSNQFDYASTWHNSSQWEGRWREPGAAGTGYYRHYVSSSSDNTEFIWQFGVQESGTYAIMATFPTNPNQDPRAEYSLNGRPMNPRNQVRASSFYKFLYYGYLGANMTHTVSVRGTTPGTYVVADGIVVRRIR